MRSSQLGHPPNWTDPARRMAELIARSIQLCHPPSWSCVRSSSAVGRAGRAFDPTRPSVKLDCLFFGSGLAPQLVSFEFESCGRVMVLIGIRVGVENGYDEVNVQLPEEEKFFDKYFFEIDSSLRKYLRKKRESSDKSSRMIVTQRPNTCSVRYVATEFEPKLSRYVATKRPFRSVAT
ncbi:hypothetical protein F2Q70_00017010 [Brassica cretica]|uniref:Uncharacterized protein n=1 Tax=Brassica cretica TaxID=69181 RepID=A0A8S9KXG8_BRACR|nr:hypothetical protein F2Q70_00017010 [Brassica cretica]KAF2598023.1 hypothetical protein F2Q68_00009964 [Brassica cretica]